MTPEPQHDDGHDTHRTARALDALGDANRRAILEVLAGGEHTVGQLAEQIPISRPAVSRHLRLLREAGLVGDRPEGTRRLYGLREAGAHAVHAYLVDMWGQAAARFSLVAENTTPSPERPT